MKHRIQLEGIALPAILLLSMLLASCGGGSGSMPSPAMPAFSSTPVTAAEEGIAYSYEVAANDSAGGMVKLALTAAPTGATLRGNTISWTPTSAQSRAANNFTVTATSASGGSATQSWTVTPSGTVHISRVDTVWNQNGSGAEPFDWSVARTAVTILVPQADGSFQSLTGSGDAQGDYEIADVPAGYYWLQISPREIYWTSSSTLDDGENIYSAPGEAITTDPGTTTLSLDLTGLDATTTSGWLEFMLRGELLLDVAATTPNAKTFAGRFQATGNIDYSGFKDAFVLQYEPITLGDTSGFALGPELTLSDLSIQNGIVNTIDGSLSSATPKQVTLTLDGSAWTPLFDHVAATKPPELGSSISAYTQPYSTNQYVNGGEAVNLIWSAQNGMPLIVAHAPCSANTNPFGSISSGSGLSMPSVLTNLNAETISYSDPFPADWLRIFNVCWTGSIGIAIPGTTNIQNLQFFNQQLTALPNAAVTPLVSAVLNPKINGSDLFTANTISTSTVTLSWSPPAVGSPVGYQVEIAELEILPNLNGQQPPVTGYLSRAALGTAKTSITLPPNIMPTGNSYLVSITALVDGGANIESSPHRSMLPIASANVISAVQTIAPAGQ